jgi:Zn-dependent peptidase ImmA (M78 family)
VTRPTKVPITPAVVAWAIRESGYSLEDLAAKIGIPARTIQAWIESTERPSLTEFHRLAAALKRPEASFFLPKVPVVSQRAVEFRHPIDSPRTEPSPEELIHLREASRLQKALSWVLKEMDSSQLDLPRTDISADAEETATDTRRRLGTSAASQLSWPSSAEAMREWRGALERTGILVFLLPMGKGACRGFSLWDARAPLIAVNTWWNNEARAFSLFHEYAHLLTRTSSVCTSGGRPALRDKADPTERWCERFAAAVLLPWGPVNNALQQRGWQRGTTVDDLSLASAISRQFKASLRATVLRFIVRGIASWDLYDQIPPVADQKTGGGGGGGRNRSKIRQDEYGHRTHQLLSAAVSQDLLSRTDVIGLLDVPEADLDALLSGREA